jgi:nicotinate-nucleotide--dimethylbenzimidazole phosphoribosyltransferase
MAAPEPLDTLAGIVGELQAPDADAAAAVAALPAARDDVLGRLGELAQWLAGVQGHCPPRNLDRARCVTFTGVAGAPGRIDLAGVGHRAVAVLRTPAEPIDGQLTSQDVQRAVALGVAAADEEIDSGADLLIVAVPDAASESPAMVIVSVLTNTEPVKVLTRGARAATPDTWMAQAEVVRDTRRRAFDHRADPDALLAAASGLPLAAAAGFVLRAAARRTGVVLDGLAATAAALVAYETAPHAVRWWLAADHAPGPAHELALTKLGLPAVLDLGLARADGSAGALTVALLRAAVQLLAATPESAPDPLL